MVDSDSTEVLGRRYVAFLVDGALAVAAGVAAAWIRAEKFPVSGRSVAQEQQLAELAEFEIFGFKEVLGVPVARAQEIGDTMWVFAGSSWRAGALMAALAAIVLFTIVPALTGRTLGMIPLGLRITDESGERPGVAAHLIRSLVGVIDLVPVVVPGALGFVLARSDRLHRRIGDQVAGTVVVDAKPASSSARSPLEGAVITPPPPSSAAERRPMAVTTDQVRPAAESIEPTKKRRLGWRGQDEDDASEMIDLSARLDSTPRPVDADDPATNPATNPATDPASVPTIDATTGQTTAGPADTPAPETVETTTDAPAGEGSGQPAAATQPLQERWNVATAGHTPPEPASETQPEEHAQPAADPATIDLPPPPSHRARPAEAEQASPPPTDEQPTPTVESRPSPERPWEPPIAETAPVWTPASFEPEATIATAPPTELGTAPFSDATPTSNAAEAATEEPASNPTPTDNAVGEPAAAAAAESTNAPIWSEKWQAWLYWDPTAQHWLRHDVDEDQWIPIA